MSCISVTSFQLASSPSGRNFQLNKASTCTSVYLGTKLPELKLSSDTYRYRKATTVCLFGGKGKSENGNEGSPWKAIENAVGKFTKSKSVEDVLKQQIQKQEYYDDGGSGGKGPGGGGGGGGGGGFGDAEEEGMLEEWTQAFLATFAFIFLYLYIIEGEEITVIIKDSIRYLFTGKQSLRLGRLVEQCSELIASMRVKEEYDPNWLEREIINTPTMYDHPAKYRYIIKALEESSSDDEEY